MKELKSRNEMDSQFTWDLTDIVKDDYDWNSTFVKLEKDIETLETYQGRVMETSNMLFELMVKKDAFLIDLHRLAAYSHMHLHEDTNNNEAQVYVQRLAALQVNASAALSFIDPEIMDAEDGLLEKFLDDDENLSVYRHHFENMLRQKKHILPKEQEELLALAGDFTSSPSDIFSMFMNADLVLPEVIDEKHKKIRLTNGNYLKLIKSRDPLVRKTAFEAMFSTLEENKNTLTSIYLSSLKKDVFEMRARRFASCQEASLDGKNISTSVYDTLIETVHQHLPVLHRYIGLRKKLLGLDELHMYDLYTPMVKEPDITYTFETAKKTVIDALMPLGDEYITILKKGFDERWIDVYENKGKRSGAYSWGAYGCHPYVLLNYQNTLNSTFTLAHEMGHALHTYYSNNNQAYINHSYPIFLAEVASTVNESLLIQHLLKTTDNVDERKYLINHYMENFRTTLFRQVMFAEFEKKAHELVENGEAVTSEVLNSLHFDLNKMYYGDDIVVDELIKYEWSRIPHFYTSFYVYQYATGFSSAVSISQKILDEGDAAVDDYMTFLKSGNSKYPLETLKGVHVDMTTPAPVEDALRVFEDLVNEMEKLTH